MKEQVRFTLDAEEAGVVLLALAMLMGTQAAGRSKSKFNSAEERGYVSASDRVIRKICSQLGLPDSFLADLIVKTRREMLQVRKEDRIAGEGGT